MANEERFERWELLEGLSPVMSLDAKRHDPEGFRLILKSPEAKARLVRILFHEPLCYRGTREPLLLREIYKEGGIYPWPLFIVRNSRYARWFYAQAADAVDKDGNHYHIAAANEIVDVISALPPVIGWLDEV
jgi:hypothetical protein